VRLAIWFLALLLAAGFAASPASAQDRYMAGLGNNPGSPVGTPLALPAGVRLVSVKGFDNRKDCKETELGVGDEELCLTFCTEEDRSYIVHIPAGTMFKHLAGEIFDRMQREKGFQNVIVVDDLNFFIADSLCAHLMLPPSEREEAKRKLRAQRAAKGEPSPANPGLPSGGRFLLRAMCLNQEMDVPGEGAEYALGTVTSHPKLRLVLGAVKGRKIEDDRARRLLQDAIWDVTEGYGLEQETLARLRALPAGR
jgi:hypothetical protein